MQGASNIVKRFLCLAYVLALVMVGFAHEPVSTYPPDAQMPVYELPDGTFASLCVADHESKPHTAKNLDCDACRLASAILMPAPPSIGGLAIAFSEDVKVFERRQRLARALYRPSSGPRAPPVRLMFA